MTLGHDLGQGQRIEWKQMNYLALFLLLTATQRLARWKPVEMPYRAETLSARERQEVDKLVEASRELEAVYWQQSDPKALDLYKSTKGSGSEAAAVDQRRTVRSNR